MRYLLLFLSLVGVSCTRAAASPSPGALCDRGDGPACRALGEEHAFGKARDLTLAADQFRRACDARDAQGCAWLGLFYDSLDGPYAKDPVRAADLYTRACDGGSGMGCFRLGWAFQDGRGVGQDDARAATLFAKACDEDYMMGCKYLGDMQVDHMVPADRATHAAKLYAEICDRPKVAAVSDVGVCGALARLFVEGRGVEKDPARAREYYRKGCAVGDPASCEAAKAQ